jgi:hypothetical protein
MLRQAAVAVFQEAIEVSGDVAGKAAFDLSAGLALGSTTSDVVAGGWLVLDPALDQGVQCVVELAVAVTVEPITGGDWPLFAGIGATPASMANAASEWIRPGWDQAHNTVAATIGPTPNASSRSGRQRSGGETGL